MNMLKNKKLVCFDLDGTLIDSVNVWNQVDAELILQLSGQHIEHHVIQAHRDEQLKAFRQAADPYLEYCRFLKQQFAFQPAAETVKEQRYSISRHFLDHVIELKTGAAQFLRQLQQQSIQLSIATTTSRSNIQRYQQYNQNIRSQIDFEQDFSLILTRENVSKIKPDPEVYLQTLQHFGLSAAECLVVEDSMIGMEAAKQAGIEVLAIYDESSAHEWQDIQRQADFSIRSYHDLLN